MFFKTFYLYKRTQDSIFTHFSFCGRSNFSAECYYHITYTFQSESTLYSSLNVKELLAWNRHDIWSLSDCHWTRTHNHLVRKRTFYLFGSRSLAADTAPAVLKSHWIRRWLLSFFYESMYDIMTSLLAGLFLISRSGVSLKNLFRGLWPAFNMFPFGLRKKWMAFHIPLLFFGHNILMLNWVIFLLMVFLMSFLTSLKFCPFWFVEFLSTIWHQWSLFCCSWVISMSFIQGAGGLVNFV